jgi:transposase
MTLDRARRNRSKVLCIAENLTLLLLPAYSPVLNPVEFLWWQMREPFVAVDFYFDAAADSDYLIYL